MVMATIKALLLGAGHGNAVFSCSTERRISHERRRSLTQKHANIPEHASQNNLKVQSGLIMVEESAVKDSKLDLPLPFPQVHTRR